MTDWIAADSQYIWHPFTQHGTETPPPVIASAQGASLFDENGREILDLISSWWTSIHGHAHPALNKALADQAATLEHVMFAGFTHKPAVTLAAKLAGLLPGDLSKVFYSDNGSTAVEVALKLAYQFWKNRNETGRTEFLAFEGAYHGDTVGAMAVGKGCGFFKAFDGLLFTVQTLPFVDTWRDDDTVEAREKQALEQIETVLKQRHDRIAALIVEPIMQGASGIRFCRPSYIRAVAELARHYGVLVIFDEVAVGFGRLGTMFACQQVDFTPDMICLSKGLSAGYLPMSVTVTTNAIYNEFLGQDFGRAFAHGHSFTANPLACAVALKSLELFDEENTMQRIAHIGARHAAFAPRLQKHPACEKVRVHGTVLAFNLSGNDGYKSAAGEKLRHWYLAHGLNIRPIGSAVYLLPPYCITDEQLDRAYDGLLAGLDTLSLQDAA